ncbi:hypothetical protein BSQ39_07265 [Loigolactobacillus backii]|uniref:restriction endonuclease subunit S n=1 Tax=Loigolactobacillus backii TaxID=375175 RepID=UPI000C1CBBF9|nr:restriction endonuclease subunit S [Loigolactobacillus backii]PIO83368.1 hypothetical protein BSQ39_07265 [Loigolactobacillus backii]
MTEVKRRVPLIRFKGFSDDWNERKLGEVSHIVAGGDIDKRIVADSGYPVIGNSLINHGIQGYYARTYRIKAPALTVTGRGDIGRAEARKNNFTPVVRVLAISTSINVDFLAASINNLSILIESTGVPQLTVPQLSSYKVDIPLKEEQSLIGDFLIHLDNLITANQRKLELLNRLKKGYLQQIFDQKLRFTGFKDAWHKCKLGDAATFINGKAFNQSELLDSGRYPVLRVGNFYTNNSWYFSNLELQDKFYAKKGDLLYTWSATFGPHIWAGNKVIYHYHIWKIELNNKIEKQFALELLEADKTKILNNTNGSTMIHITKNEMESKKIYIPNNNEQEKIGNFFRIIDDLVIVNQKKLKLLRKQKKALLQKIFIQ